jgi:antitoxin MazE
MPGFMPGSHVLLSLVNGKKDVDGRAEPGHDETGNATAYPEAMGYRIGEGPMKRLVRKIGKAHGVLIPKSLLEKHGLRAGDKVDIVVKPGRVRVSSIGHHPRAGWAEDSKALAAAGEADLIWPDSGNDWEGRWKW